MSESTARSTRPVLVFGGSGQVGRVLAPLLSTRAPVIAPTRSECDLENPRAIDTMIRGVRPSAVMNAAALTNVDEAEREPARAHAINGVAPGVMAQASRHVGAVMMHYSTDYVFDGAATTPYHESAAPGPINVYGASKLAGERNVAAANGPYLIIRTSWVYSAGGTGFVATLLRELPTTERIRVVEDQVGSPTWSRSLAMATAEILWKITDHGGDALSRTDWGVYHLAGSGQASRVEIAHAVLDTLAEQGETIRAQIVPVSAATFGALAPRPRYTALSNERISARLGVSLPPWRTALRQMLNARVR